MPVSNAELRILITAQDRAKAVMAGTAETVARVTQAVQQLGASRGFQTAAQGAQQLGTAISALGRGNQIAQMTNSMRAFGQAAQQAAQQARAAGQVDFLGGKQAGGQAQAAALNSALSSIQAAFRTAQATAASAGASISQSLMAIGNAARGVAGGVAGGLSAAVNGLTSMIGGINSVAGSIMTLSRSTTGLTKSAQDVNTFSGSIRSMTALGASIVGFQGMVNVLQRGWEAFTGAAIGFNSTLENTHIALTNLFKDEGKAAAFTAQLRDMAEKTAFEFPDLLKMAQGFLAVGMNAESVIPIMKDVAGVVTSIGGTTVEINRVGRALQQIMTTGRVQSDEMNQLAEARVPGWAILASAIKRTDETMEEAIGRTRKLSEQGKISAADFFNAWQKYSRDNNLRTLAEDSVKSFTGAMSNVRDSLRFLVSDATEPLFKSLSAGLQNFSQMLMSAPVRQFALDVGATMKEVVGTFAPVGEAFGRIFEGLKTEGVAGALHAIVTEFAGFTSEVGQAGIDLMASYANGIIQGASDMIQGAVDFVADLIASFLIGNSPPPSGPLAGIEEGGRNVGIAWVAGLTSGLEGVEAAVVNVTDAFGKITGALSLDQAQAAFEGAKGSLTGLADVAEEAEGALRTLNEQQRALDREQGGLTTQVEDIKSAYGEQIDALERSIDIIKEQNTYAEKYADLILKQNDAITEQADLKDRAALNEIKAAQIAAEGDPVKKAQLTKQLAENKAKQEGLAIAQREQDLDRQARQATEKEAEYHEKMADWEKKRAEAKKEGKKFETKPPEPPDPKELTIARQKIAADREENAIKKQIYDQTNHAAMAQLEADENAIKSAAAVRHAQEERAKMGPLLVKNAAEQERIMKEIEALPLEEQAEALKKAQEDALRPLNQQLEDLKQQERKLQDIRKEWQALKGDITDAIQAQKGDEAAAKKAAGGAGGGFAGGPMNLDKVAIDVKAGAEKVGKSMAEGVAKGFEDHFGQIIFGVLGGILGGTLFGPLGLAAGAAFGAQVGAGVQSRIPNLSTIFGDMGRTFLQAFGGEWSSDHEGEWVSPIVDAAGKLGLIFRWLADTIAAAWEAIKGPIATGVAWIKDHFGLVVAALTGLLIPAFALLLATVSAIVAPIIALLAPLTPAILALSAAAVLLKLAWDTNFGGIRDTVMAAIPPILDAFGKLKEAWDLLSQGDTSGAMDLLLQALSQIGAAITPILVGVGQAIWEQVQIWGTYLWEWVVAATPGVMSAIADFANAVVDFIKQNAEPFLRALLGWGKAFVLWIAPMIPPLIVGLATLIDNVLTWIGAQLPAIAQALTKWAVIFVVWIITDVIPQLPGLLQQVGDIITLGIVTLVPRVLTAIRDIAVGIGTGFMEGLAESAPQVHQALMDLWTQMTDIWTTITTTVQGVIDTIVGIWNSLPGFLQATWNTITSVFQAGIDMVVNIWNAGWALVQSVWDAIWATISGAIQAAWDALDADTQASITAMVAAIQALWESLVALAAAIWAAIVAEVTAELTTLQGYFDTWVATAQTLWETFSTTLETIWTALVAIATTVWTEITTEITTIVTAFTTEIQKEWEIITKAVSDVWELLSTTIGPIVQKVVDAITAVIVAWWAAEQAKMEQWKKVGTDWATWIMDALLAGINAKIQAVTGAVTTLANTLSGIINKALGRDGGTGVGGIDTSGTLQQQAVQAAQKYGISPAKFLAQLQQESGFNPNAQSPAGAKGIAQFMPGTGNAMAAKMGVDPEKFWGDVSLQIEGAAMHMKELNDQFGDYDKALAAYNAGAGAVTKFGGIPPYQETQTYVRNINAAAQNISIPSVAKMGTGAQGDPGRGLSMITKRQGEWAAGMADAGTICGPYLAALFADAVGRPPSPQEAKDLATKMGVYQAGAGITNASAFGDLATAAIQQFNPGTTAKATQTPVSGPIEARNIAMKSLQAGSPIVGFNTPEHYFGATGYNAETGKFKTGGTGQVFGEQETELTIARIAELGKGITAVITLTGQMGDGFVDTQQKATEAVTATSTTVGQAGSTVATTTDKATEAAANLSSQSEQLISSSTDTLGNVTRIYADASGVIGATITDASGQVVNAWGVMAEAHAQGTAAAQAAAVQAQALADTLTAGMVPAGAEAGNQIQRMTDDINPLLAEIAAGTLTTDQLVMKLGALSLNAGLTSAPLTGMADKTLTAKEAMLLMLAEAAKVDPQFAAMSEQLLATDASAQTMAVTFAEGVANSVGVATAAVEQMATGVDPLIAAVDSGAVSGKELEKIIVEMADAAGLATKPFREMSDGMIDSNQALEDVIKLSSTVSPEFETLSKEVEAAGTVSEESAKKYLELVKAFKQGIRPADAAATAAEDVGTQVEGATEPVALLANTMTEQATLAAEQFGTVLTTGMQTGIESVRALAPDAEAAGNEVGTAIVRGLEAGIESAAEAVAQKAADVVKKAIEAAKAEAKAESPSKKTTELGLNLSAGLEVGQIKGSPGVEDAARTVVAAALGAAQDEASAHSASQETRELGFNMNAGLEMGQIEDSRFVEDAARGVIASALDAMRDESDSHSASGEGVRIGKDIMKGLEKGLRSSKTSDVARDQIQEYIKIAGNFSDQFAKQIDIGVAQIQHQLAGIERENLGAQLAVKDAMEAQERAAQGTLAQRQELNALTLQELTLQLEIAKTAQSDLDTMNALRDAEQERDKILDGSLESQVQMAQLGLQVLNIAKESAVLAQQQAGIDMQLAELDLQSAQAAQESLGVRQELAAVEAERAKTLKGSLDIQLRQAAIGQRNAAIAVDLAKAEQAMLPLKQQAAAIQREIEKATKGTVDQQQKAIRAEAEQAAKRIQLLEIQDKLAAAEGGTSGLSQDEINALHAQEASLQTQAESNSRQAEIEKLKQTIALAGLKEQQVALTDQISTKEDSLIPVQDEKALLDAEQQVIGANLALAAAGYDEQVIKLQDEVAQHDAIALQLENERATLDAQAAILGAQQGILDARTGILEAQQGIITTTNEANAAAMDVQIIKLQAAADAVELRQQHEQDVLDKIGNQKTVIEATTELEAARHQANITALEEQLYIQEAQQRAVERMLEIQQATANVISTQVSLANALKSALEMAGVIGDKDSGKKKKKKKAAGGSIYGDDIVLVGEHGPEVIVPPEDGYVLNNATTERLMSALDIVDPRIDQTVRERQTGGTVWGNRPYLVGEGNGVEGFSTWNPGQTPNGSVQPLKVVNATVHYHVHEQQRSGEARVERVVYETLMVALNS